MSSEYFDFLNEGDKWKEEEEEVGEEERVSGGMTAKAVRTKCF